MLHFPINALFQTETLKIYFNFIQFILYTCIYYLFETYLFIFFPQLGKWVRGFLNIDEKEVSYHFVVHSRKFGGEAITFTELF